LRSPIDNSTIGQTTYGESVGSNSPSYAKGIEPLRAGPIEISMPTDALISSDSHPPQDGQRLWLTAGLWHRTTDPVSNAPSWSGADSWGCVGRLYGDVTVRLCQGESLSAGW